MVPLGPGYNFGQQCPQCGRSSNEANALNQQITDLIAKNGQLSQELASTKQLATNQQANVNHLESRANEALERSRAVEEAASEKWKLVALALDMPLPEAPESQAYQGKRLYTAEYIVDCITKVRAKITVYEEIIRILRGKMAIEAEAHASTLRQIGQSMVGELLKIEAPNILAEKDGH